MKLRSFLLIASLTLFASPAAALTFVDIDSMGGQKLSRNGTDSISGVFDVTTAGIEGDSYNLWLPYSLFPTNIKDIGGFEVGKHETVGASVLLAVRDDWDYRREYMVVELGDTVSGPVEVDFGIERFDVAATLYATIDATGQLEYEIKAKRGDFYVDYAALFVRAKGDYGQGGPPIPEANALAAYAAGTLIIAGYVRRRRR